MEPTSPFVGASHCHCTCFAPAPRSTRYSSSTSQNRTLPTLAAASVPFHADQAASSNSIADARGWPPVGQLKTEACAAVPKTKDITTSHRIQVNFPCGSVPNRHRNQTQMALSTATRRTLTQDEPAVSWIPVGISAPQSHAVSCRVCSL